MLTNTLSYLGSHNMKQVFEHSVASMGPEGRNEAGRFLQVGCHHFFHLFIQNWVYHFLIRWVDSSSSLTFVDLAFTDLYLLRSKLLFRMRMQLAVVLLYDCQNINVDDEDGTRCRVTTALCSMNQSRTTNFTRWPLTTPGHLDPDHKVVMTEYVAGGGDGFKIIAENKEKHLQVKIYLAHTSFHHMPSRGPLTLTFWGNTSKRDRRWIISEPLVSTVIQKISENLVAGWRNGSRCGRSMENNFQALSPHSHLRSSTIYYVSKPSIMSWRNFSAENIYLFWKRKNVRFLKNTRNVKHD